VLPISHGIGAAAPIQGMDSFAKSEQRTLADRKEDGTSRRVQAKLLPRLACGVHNGHSPWPLLEMDHVLSPPNLPGALFL
jgi:hypothetical protein